MIDESLIYIGNAYWQMASVWRCYSCGSRADIAMNHTRTILLWVLAMLLIVAITIPILAELYPASSSKSVIKGNKIDVELYPDVELHSTSSPKPISKGGEIDKACFTPINITYDVCVTVCRLRNDTFVDMRKVVDAKPTLKGILMTKKQWNNSGMLVMF